MGLAVNISETLAIQVVDVTGSDADTRRIAERIQVLTQRWGRHPVTVMLGLQQVLERALISTDGRTFHASVEASSAEVEHLLQLLEAIQTHGEEQGEEGEEQSDGHSSPDRIQTI